MAEDTKIEWTDATWNPWHGCHKVGPGCKLCYMFSDKKRYGQDPNVVIRSKTTFNAPLKWKDPALVFTCSWSDWFIEEADAWREEAYDIIRRTPHLTYQILTKRPERMAGRVPNPPLPNIWFGVSTEDQPHADKRIVELLQTPAAVRFISAEPLLGSVAISRYLDGHEEHGVDLSRPAGSRIGCCVGWTPPLDWVIVGGESGPGARPCDMAWIRSIVAQCQAAHVPVFVKQLGARAFSGHSLHKQIHHRSTDGNLYWKHKDRKGGSPDEWPEGLRVRQMPNANRIAEAE